MDGDFEDTLKRWIDLPRAEPEPYRDVVPDISETILALAERYRSEKEFRHPSGSPIEDAEKKACLTFFSDPKAVPGKNQERKNQKTAAPRTNPARVWAKLWHPSFTLDHATSRTRGGRTKTRLSCW